MGANLIAMDGLFLGSATQFADLGHFISASHAHGLKTAYLFGYDNIAFVRDIYLAHPDLLSVRRPPKVEWERLMCPLAFMSSPDVGDRLKRLAKLNDRLVFDIENGIGGVCFCHRCMEKITKDLGLPAQRLPR